MHWSQTTISAYQLYDYWLNSALSPTNNASGNFRAPSRARRSTADLSPSSPARPRSPDRSKDAAPIRAGHRRAEPADHPGGSLLHHGAAFQTSTTRRTSPGWPSTWLLARTEVPDKPGSPQNEVVVLRLKPTSNSANERPAPLPPFQGSGAGWPHTAKNPMRERTRKITTTAAGSDADPARVARPFPEGIPLEGAASSAYPDRGGGARSDNREAVGLGPPSVWPHAGPKGARRRHGRHRLRGSTTAARTTSTTCAEELGLGAFRSSISWPRVRPSWKRGAVYGQRGLDFYRSLVDRLQSPAPPDPAISLYHWDLPQRARGRQNLGAP